MGIITNIKNALSPTPKIVQSAKTPIVPIQLLRIRQDVTTRAAAINEAERAYYPFRVNMQQMYVNTRENGFIKACVERRKDLTLLRKWEFKTASGEVDQQLTDLLCHTVNGKTQLKTWFSTYLSICMDALFFGYSVIHLDDIVDGEFPYINTVKRQNVSPDRITIGSFPYMTTGCKIQEEEEFKNWYIFVGTPNDTGASRCGYGLFWELSIYEIFMRNLLGFNGDFVELFSQPFRVGKTNKTNEAERQEFANTLAQMGSSGWAVLDDIGDSIEFIETSLGGSGYKGYNDFEARLEAKVSQIILGHADAMKSIAGKLGNSNEESPAQKAMEDKATKDAAFILPLVNKQLFDRLRALGFNIAEGSVACMMNDSEEVENANTIADLSVKIKQGGLQMDGKYFTEKTGIPLAEIVAPTPNAPTFPAKIQNKLNQMYSKHTH